MDGYDCPCGYRDPKRCAYDLHLCVGTCPCQCHSKQAPPAMTAPRDKAREIVAGMLRDIRVAQEHGTHRDLQLDWEMAITAALIEARESALEEAAVAFESNEHNGIWKHAVAMGLRALKGKP